MDETTEPVPIFEETQDPPWPLMALGVGGPAVGILAAAKGLSMAARFGAAGVAAGGLGLALREFLFPLQTTLLSEELRILFGRRTRFRIPLRNVVRAYARTYSPLGEYGGWGIRNGPGGRAFNMRGTEGVQLVMKSGQRVLIGSERAEELAGFIRELSGASAEPEFEDEPSEEEIDEVVDWEDDETVI